jgi:hypothetical protein
MELRQNPKQKKIEDNGRIISNEKFHARRRAREKYLRRNQKEAAITANMIKLLTIAGSINPEDHLNFWRENLKSDYPVVELRKSNLVNAGLGVFVTDNCVFLPNGLMYIPHSIQEPQETAAESPPMSLYQFMIETGRGTFYIFPTLEPDASLPNEPLISFPDFVDKDDNDDDDFKLFWNKEKK